MRKYKCEQIPTSLEQCDMLLLEGTLHMGKLKTSSRERGGDAPQLRVNMTEEFGHWLQELHANISKLPSANS